MGCSLSSHDGIESTSSVPSKLRNCAVPPDHLCSAIPFSRTCNLLNLIRYVYLYISQSPFNFGSGSLVYVSAWLRSCMRFLRSRTYFCSVYNFLRGNTVDQSKRHTHGFSSLCVKSISTKINCYKRWSLEWLLSHASTIVGIREVHRKGFARLFCHHWRAFVLLRRIHPILIRRWLGVKHSLVNSLQHGATRECFVVHSQRSTRLDLRMSAASRFRPLRWIAAMKGRVDGCFDRWHVVLQNTKFVFCALVVGQRRTRVNCLF